MFKFQLPIFRGTDLFPDVMRSPVAVRIDIVTPDRLTESKQLQAVSEAMRIVNDNIGEISRKYLGLHQRYELDDLTYMKTSRPFGNGSGAMTLSNNFGQQLMTLTVYPKLEAAEPTKEKKIFDMPTWLFIDRAYKYPPTPTFTQTTAFDYGIVMDYLAPMGFKTGYDHYVYDTTSGGFPAKQIGYIRYDDGKETRSESGQIIPERKGRWVGGYGGFIDTYEGVKTDTEWRVQRFGYELSRYFGVRSQATPMSLTVDLLGSMISQPLESEGAGSYTERLWGEITVNAWILSGSNKIQTVLDEDYEREDVNIGTMVPMEDLARKAGARIAAFKTNGYDPREQPLILTFSVYIGGGPTVKKFGRLSMVGESLTFVE